MKRSSLYILAAALVAAFTLAVLPTQQPVSADSDSKKAIAEAMEVLAGNYRQIRRNLLL